MKTAPARLLGWSSAFSCSPCRHNRCRFGKFDRNFCHNVLAVPFDSTLGCHEEGGLAVNLRVLVFTRTLILDLGNKASKWQDGDYPTLVDEVDIIVQLQLNRSLDLFGLGLWLGLHFFLVEFEVDVELEPVLDGCQSRWLGRCRLRLGLLDNPDILLGRGSGQSWVVLVRDEECPDPDDTARNNDSADNEAEYLFHSVLLEKK